MKDYFEEIEKRLQDVSQMPARPRGGAMPATSSMANYSDFRNAVGEQNRKLREIEANAFQMEQVELADLPHQRSISSLMHFDELFQEELAENKRLRAIFADRIISTTGRSSKT